MNLSSHIGGPEVSVLMCCYNARRWLNNAIDSVLAQTLENFELIVIDDGSTDDTWEIIRSYCDRDRRIVPISKKNTGLTESLNVGIAKARGVWIARLDADDLCDPRRLDQQVCYMKENPQVVLLGTGFTEIGDFSRIGRKNLFPTTHRELVRRLERLQGFFPHSSALFSREAAQRLGGYSLLFRKSQDWDLWLRFAEIGMISCLRKCLVKVRKHEGQISNSTSGFSQLVYGAAASVCHFLRISGCSDPSASNEEAIRQEFLAWVQMHLVEKGAIARRRTWADAHVRYLSAETKLVGAIRFGAYLLRSGHADALIADRLVGTTLPQRLALEWMNRPCVAS